jgi:hypothetical protein
VGVWVSHLGDNSLSAVRSEEVVGDTAANTGSATLGSALNDGVKVVLGRQGIAHGSSEWLEVNAADGPVLNIELLKKGVDVGSEMGSVETTNTNVDDTLLDTLSLIGGNGNILQLCKVLGVKLDGCSGCLTGVCGGGSGNLLILSVSKLPGWCVVHRLALRGVLASSLRALEPDGSDAVRWPGGLENSPSAGGSQKVSGDLRRHDKITYVSMERMRWMSRGQSGMVKDL